MSDLKGFTVFASPRAQLGSIVSLAADVSLTLLSDRVHRGSLANARRALDEKRDYDLGSARMLREFEDRARRGFGPYARPLASG